MKESHFIPEKYLHNLKNGSVTWQSPSNIALVKYWGKYGQQNPKNASISFTLNNCNTLTELKYFLKDSQNQEFDFNVYFEGEKKDDFKPKIESFFERIEQYIPFLKHYRFEIHTSNTFPHSSGIASSASGMSAIALCIMSMEKLMLPEVSSDYFNQKASFLARLGSGSACRSIKGELIVWGAHENIQGSSQLFGIQYPYQVHDNFKNYQDTILLVDKGEKQVSSTVGHNLMKDHPFAEQRFQQANENLSKLIPVLEQGNVSEFIKIVESEALSLHAMMMTSMPYFILMKPNTLEIINRIWSYRKLQNSAICFTLDAGANVHVLYPENEKETVLVFIKNELAPFCKNGEFIIDQVGFGAIQK
ncbi:diphosphomevalonate decarboxylase [Candidatus Marifrigoribacter sp. Uisw_064]|jgi:diphosphomevalonate decarboxylase|uniref:diphosphomevalonate/mevalonate 3,5-bisphosphate decarboxylase family protein n=1 Tax=Candidatus Marifrigoribacter sp. Uisw_064 TaxID=3230970 RepID=UPI003D51CB6D